jgi:chromosome segregation ATPase
MNEPTPKFEYEEPSNRGKAGVIIAAFVLLAAANVYFFTKLNRVQVKAATLQAVVDTEISRIKDSSSFTSGQTRRGLLELRAEIQHALDATEKAAQKHARVETGWLAKNVSSQQREQQEQLLGELRNVDGKTSQTQQRVEEVNGEVVYIRAEVDETQAELARTGSELSQTASKVGAINEKVATHEAGITVLRQLSERDRIGFHLSKSKFLQKVGDVQLRLRGADAKRNKYTLEVLADDIAVVKRERNVNEPVQFYVTGSTQPYEIVITRISKDKVTGYLATPKVKTTRG